MASGATSNTISSEKIAAAFGRLLSASEWQACLSPSNRQRPPIGQFWASDSADAGIYMVVAGKVRLLDPQGELIFTLQTGGTFGETTLFSEFVSPEYKARAAMDVELIFFPRQVLEDLWHKHPEVQIYLRKKATDFSEQLQAKNHHNTAIQPPPPAQSPEISASKSRRPEHPKLSKALLPTPQQRMGHLWRKVTHRYPFFAQQSSSDCGAACLVMVATHWGKKFSVNRLRDAANIDREGASLRGIVAAAESIGFQTRPVKASLDQLTQQPLPAILHWENKHYVVVYEIQPRYIIIVDPALGQQRISHREFTDKWTGYALLLQPTALFKELPEDKQSLWQFAELLSPHKLVLAEVVIASIFIQIFGLITPLLTQLILDRVVVQRSEITLTAVGLGLLIFSLFKVAMTGLRQYLLDHTANKIDLALIVAFIRHTLKLPLNFFESRYVGDIISRVEENRKIQKFLSGQALSIILDLFTVFIYIALMCWYSWKMTLAVLLVVPPFVILAIVATPFLQKISREIFGAFAKENSYLIEVLTGIRTVKSTAVEQQVRWHWEGLFNKEVKTNFASQMIGNRLQMASNLIEALATSGLLWFGASLVLNNQLTIGQLVAFNLLLGNVISPFQRLTQLWNEFQEIIISVERIQDVLDAELEEDLQNQSRQSLPRLRGHIEFRNVTFRYNTNSDTNTLENLSFVIKPGQTVALVGRSGSGKTTVSKLVLGLYTPTSGQILIDGVDLTKIALRSLRQQVGVVDQDTFLFGGTIRDNLTLGHPDASLAEIIEAGKLAGADAFIRQLPIGYETQIGEGGGMLSGGQRQRLAIARALLGNPRLLILDEATSSLDAESEQIIQKNLATVLQGRSSLVIAHRLSTVRNADLILVLDRGILVESGNHDQLMQKRGHYFYLNQQQLNITDNTIS